MRRLKRAIEGFILLFFGLSILGALPGVDAHAASPGSIMAGAIIQSQAGPTGSAQAGEVGSGKSVPPSKDFKQRHARHGVQCSDCHGADQSLSSPTMVTCLQCHGSYKDVAALTKGLHPNPHDSHMGEVKCKLCHKEHKDSELSCNRCHVFEMKVP